MPPAVLTTFIAFLVVLTLVVFVHELGHFLVARWNGVRVDVFSIGFGPRLFGVRDRHGTEWRFSAIPLGGYVKFFGDAGPSSARADDEQEMTPEERAVAFHYKSVWQRMAIVFAGPLANMVFSIVVFAGVYWGVGIMMTPPVVSSVQPDSAAAEAGIQEGDHILQVNGTPIERFEDIQHLIPLTNGESITITLRRNAETLTVTATPRVQTITDELGETRQQAVLGIAANASGQDLVRLGPVQAVGQAFEQAYKVVHATGVTVGQMIAGERGTEDLGGPVRIAQMSGQVAELGFVSLLLFSAFLSVNLGLINLLPVPVLDGGHLVFYAIEAVRGEPVGERAQEYGFRLGLVFLVGLMVFVTWNDLVRLING